MLGLSLGKLLVLILVVLAVWRGMRIVNDFRARAMAMDQRRRASHAAGQRGMPHGAGARPAWERGDAVFRPADGTTDLVACPRCGTYVPNGTICRSTAECRFRR
jgi:hypothetical protein